MGKTPRRIRSWVKQEKRIVKLMYLKGFIDVDINNLYWEEYKLYGKRYRSKYSGRKYQGYLPEIYFAVADYWSEAEIPLVGSFVEHRIWEDIPDDRLSKLGESCMEDIMDLSDFKYKGRRWLIKWLSGKPNVRCDNKINKILKRENR